MDQFIVLNIATVTFIIIETCLVFYLTNKKKFPAQWYSLKLFVYLCKWSNLVPAITYCCCFCCQPKGKWNKNLETPENNGYTKTNAASLYTDNNDIKSNANVQQNSSFNNINNISNNSNDNEAVNSSPTKPDSPKGIQKEHSKLPIDDSRSFPSYTSTLKSPNYASNRPKRNVLNESTTSFMDIETLSESELTWKKLGTAIDALWQFTISIFYIIYLSILLVETTKRPS